MLALACPAVLINVGHGQNGFLTAALLGGALVLLDRRPIVAGILFVPIGLAIRKLSNGLGWALVIAGPIAALACAPSILLERAYVDDQGFSVNSGILGMTACQDLKFDRVRSFRIEEEETGGRSSRLIP